MTGKNEFFLARERLSMDDCFWGTNAMMYGDRAASAMVKESEDKLRQVASAIIAESCGEFAPDALSPIYGVLTLCS